jgi:hypothetical protein
MNQDSIDRINAELLRQIQFAAKQDRIEKSKNETMSDEIHDCLMDNIEKTKGMSRGDAMNLMQKAIFDCFDNPPPLP